MPDDRPLAGSDEHSTETPSYRKEQGKPEVPPTSPGPAPMPIAAPNASFVFPTAPDDAPPTADEDRDAAERRRER